MYLMIITEGMDHIFSLTFTEEYTGVGHSLNLKSYSSKVTPCLLISNEML